MGVERVTIAHRAAILVLGVALSHGCGWINPGQPGVIYEASLLGTDGVEAQVVFLTPQGEETLSVRLPWRSSVVEVPVGTASLRVRIPDQDFHSSGNLQCVIRRESAFQAETVAFGACVVQER